MTTTTDTVRTLDIRAPGFFLRHDYHDVLAWLRANEPVCELADGTWLVSRYDDIREVSRRPDVFSSRRGALINDPRRDHGPDDRSGSLLHLDPPLHTEHRKLLNRRFTPRSVARLETTVRTTVDQVLDALHDDEIDVVSDVAAPIPVVVIAELLGVVGADRNQFRRWSDAIIEISDRPHDPAIASAAAELFAFLDGHVRARIDAGGHDDDLVSMLAGATVGGKPLTHHQLVMFCLTLLVAGNETTRSLLSGGLLALAEHPDQREVLLADPSLLPGAVEELLRWVTPIQAFCRTTTGAVELAGRRLPAGAYVVMLYASGNRDEAAFGPTASELDVRRPASPSHVAFGFGEHLCLGAALARLEARIAFEQVLRRFPTYEVAGAPTYIPSTLTASLDSLPVRLR